METDGNGEGVTEIGGAIFGFGVWSVVHNGFDPWIAISERRWSSFPNVVSKVFFAPRRAKVNVLIVISPRRTVTDEFDSSARW